MGYQIGLISLGCPKNQVDAERMLALIDEAGHSIVDYVDGCDIVIINTCGFIDDAKKEAKRQNKAERKRIQSKRK